MKIGIKPFSTRITNVKTNKEPRVKGVFAALIVKKIKKESDRFTYTVHHVHFARFPSFPSFDQFVSHGTYARKSRVRVRGDTTKTFQWFSFLPLSPRLLHATSRVNTRRAVFPWNAWNFEYHEDEGGKICNGLKVDRGCTKDPQAYRSCRWTRQGLDISNTKDFPFSLIDVCFTYKLQLFLIVVEKEYFTCVFLFFIISLSRLDAAISVALEKHVRFFQLREMYTKEFASDKSRDNRHARVFSLSTFVRVFLHATFLWYYLENDKSRSTKFIEAIAKMDGKIYLKSYDFHWGKAVTMRRSIRARIESRSILAILLKRIDLYFYLYSHPGEIPWGKYL